MKFPPKVSSCFELLDKFERFCIDPTNTYIGRNVQIGEGTMIEPGVYIHDRPDGGINIIGKNCRIGSGAKLREWFEIGNNVLISGAEVVRSKIGDFTKAIHWCHIGDAQIGQHCNISAGAVIANYDGLYKHQTILGDYVFVGVNTSLVAPLVIKSGAFIAAGAIVTKEVPEYALVTGVNQVHETKASWPNERGWEIVSKTDHPVLKESSTPEQYCYF